MADHRLPPRGPRPGHAGPPVRLVADRSVRARLRGVGLWFVTGFDDIVVERFWGRLRRGDVRGAFRVWAELLFGFWGCAVVPLAFAAAIALLVAALHAPHDRGRAAARPARALQRAPLGR